MSTKSNSPDLIDPVLQYYSEKILTFGPTPAGVDWNSIDSQLLRFKKLTQSLLEGIQEFSMLDFGCGYGALLSYLETTYQGKSHFKYIGFDLSKQMLAAAGKLRSDPQIIWTPELPTTKVDFAVASGIFNVKLNAPNSEWHKYILGCLDTLNQVSTKGFAFNALTSYSDDHKKRQDLFYASPTELFDYCKSRYSRFVNLLHDYPLYEFTIIVKK